MSANPSALVNIGLVGLKNHGQTILRAILDAGNLELRAVYDIDSAAVEEAHRLHGVNVSPSYEALAADPALDAVALVTPNHLHAGQVALAARHGKHVFVEKPIANSVADARAMIAAMRDAGRVLMVGHNTRRKRSMRAAAAMLADEDIGAVIAVEGTMARHVGLESGLPEWKSDPESCVLLPMSQLGIHFADAVQALFGPVASVACFAANRAMRGGALDAVSALLLTESGIPVTLSAHYSTLDTWLFRIYGADGVITCSPDRLHAELLMPHDAVDLDFSDEGHESFILQLREFGDCIRTGSSPETGGEEALRAFAVVEAMQQSVDERRIVGMSELLG